MRRLIFSLVVLATLLSCEEVTNVDNIENDIVQILAPTNNAVLKDGDISFNWEFVAGADSYLLQIATPNFASANQVVLDSLVPANQFTQMLEANEYEWRVKAVNSVYETEYTSNIFKVLNDISDETIQLTAPADAATLEPGTIAFDWDSVSGAENYNFQITTSDFNSSTDVLVDTLLTATSFNQELMIGSYKWRVKAINALSETEYAENSLTIETP